MCCTPFAMPITIRDLPFKAFFFFFVWPIFGFLRVGELVNTLSKQSDRPLNFSDVIGHDLTSATVCVRTSKTNQSGPTVFLRIPSEACNIICPVRALNKFFHNRPPCAGLLFVHEKYRRLTRYQFHAVLTKTIKYIKGKQKSPGGATSRSRSQPPTPGGSEKVT